MKKKHVVAGQDWEFDGKTITVHIPMTFKRRGGRKVIIAPDGGGAWPLAKPRPDETLIRAMAPAHRWKQMLENGTHRSISELAGAEKINRAYGCRLLRLTPLALHVVEAILRGQACRMSDELIQPKLGVNDAGSNIEQSVFSRPGNMFAGRILSQNRDSMLPPDGWLDPFSLINTILGRPPVFHRSLAFANSSNLAT